MSNNPDITTPLTIKELAEYCNEMLELYGDMAVYMSIGQFVDERLICHAVEEVAVYKYPDGELILTLTDYAYTPETKLKLVWSRESGNV